MSPRLGIVIAFPLLISAVRLALAQPVHSRIDSLFSSAVHADSPGAAVIVRHHGRTVFIRGYGVRDLRTRAKINALTDFRLASLSKQFTAIAVMLLIHDGKLRYDTHITDVFPDFPAYGRAITVRHLLTHTSGLPDYEDLMERSSAGTSGWNATRQIQDQEVLELLKQQTAGKFAPGMSWSYSNSGYVLLGLIVARISGEPFPHFLQHRVFGPLHMMGTLAWVKGKDQIPNRAFGYSRTRAAFELDDQSATSATLGDGGIYSNVTDLARWDDALHKHQLLSREEMNVALSPAMLANGAQPSWPLTPGEDNLAPGQPVMYGFGWFLDPWRGHKRMWHFGSTAGFRTAIQRFTTDQLTVVVLCNRTDVDAGKYALQIADLVLGGR